MNKADDVIFVEVQLGDALTIGATLATLAHGGYAPADQCAAMERVGKALRQAGAAVGRPWARELAK